MARIATAPRFAPDTRKTLSRDPRDFHHGLLAASKPLFTHEQRDRVGFVALGPQPA